MILIIKFKNMLDSQNGKVLTLIYQNTQGKLQLNYNTITHISRYKGPFCFISICGDYRSGKSFLLNSLFFDYKGFETSGTTEACTKGINIWSQPVESNGKLVWLLDTQGFGSIQKDSNYDGKIFLLSLLMSSVVIYNSFGAIDENSISKLALACHEAQFVNPKFANVKLFWVLRDFSLEMVDKQGTQLTADEYLQQCFRVCSNGYNKKEKQFLKKLFPTRHCSALIRPVIDETTLNSLQNVNKLCLREQFKQAVDQLKESIICQLQNKVAQGICIDQNNAGLILKEFVAVLNSEDIDCGLTCTYQKIKSYQRQQEKQKLIQLVRTRLDSTKKLLPVKKEHILYLSSELKKLVQEKLQQIKEFTSNDIIDTLKLSLDLVIEKQIAKIRNENTCLIETQGKDFLYRNMIELYPKFISLTNFQFENKFDELINPFRQHYMEKYHDYYADQAELQSIYGRFMEKQIKKIFFQLAKRWRNHQKQLQERLQELKKFKKLYEEDLKRTKDQKQKTIKSLQQHRRQEGRSLSKLKQDMQDAFRQQVITISQDYQQKLRVVTETKEKQLKQLKSQFDMLTQQKIGLQTSSQYEKKSLLQKIALQKEKSDLMNIKYEQLKGNYEMQMEQFKMSYQNKIRIADMKYNENYNTLVNQRKKFQMLTEERRKEQTQILQELQVKNQLIQNLNRELQGLEDKYKNQLEKILSEQKEILVKTINKRIQEYQYKCKIYQGKLQECAVARQDLQFYEKKNDELQIQMRQLKMKLEEEGDKSDSLSSKLKKCENQLHEKDNALTNMRTNFQKQISLANENIYNNKKFIKEMEQRHQEEIDYFKRKMEVDLIQQASCIVSANQENMRQNRIILQQKFDKQRSQLKEIIKNNYDQIEHLKLQCGALSNQIQKIYGILLMIRNKHQSLGQSVKKDSQINYHQQEENSYDLGQISESPQEYSQQIDENNKKSKFQKTEYLAEQIQQIFEIMNQQIKILSKERMSIKKEIQLQNQKLDTFDVMLSKLKNQNKHYKKEVDQLRKKQSSLQSVSIQVQNLQQKYESIMNENFQLRKQLDLQKIANNQREESIKQNITIYKQTIYNLTEQKRLMSDSIKNLSDLNIILEQQLERFNLWAKQTMPQKEGLKLKNEKDVEMSADKIKDLENEIRRLTKRSQQEKKIKMQKELKRQNVFTTFVNQNRISELQELRKQNENLYRKLQEFQEQELKSIEEKKTNKQKHLEYQQSRYSVIRDQYDLYKKKAKQIVGQLEAQLQIQRQQNNQIKKQFQDLEENIVKKYQFQLKYMTQQIENLKIQKQGLSDFYTKKIAILQESLNSKINESDKKLAETQLKYEKQKDEIQKQHNTIVLQGERHRLKYQHLLKVNNQLLKQIQSLKSKAHQITLKEKYKSKILTLFND